jgi:hypothetical protein
MWDVGEILGGTQVRTHCASQRVALTQNNLQRRPSYDFLFVLRWQDWEKAANAEQMVLESTQIVMMQIRAAVWY